MHYQLQLDPPCHLIGYATHVVPDRGQLSLHPLRITIRASVCADATDQRLSHVEHVKQTLICNGHLTKRIRSLRPTSANRYSSFRLNSWPSILRLHVALPAWNRRITVVRLIIAAYFVSEALSSKKWLAAYLTSPISVRISDCV